MNVDVQPNLEQHYDRYYEELGFVDQCVFDGELDILRWAYARHYPFTKGTCLVAASMGHLEVLKFLLEEVFAGKKIAVEPIEKRALKDKQTEILQWLKERV